MATTEERLTALETKVATLEANVITRGQYKALKTLYSSNFEELRDSINQLTARFEAVELNQNALQNARFNHRAEFVASTPTLVSGTTYELPDTYDPEAVFIVFNPVVRVAESNLTLAAVDDTEPESKRFDSAIVLAADAKVFYFVKIPALSEPTF